MQNRVWREREREKGGENRKEREMSLGRYSDKI